MTANSTYARDKHSDMQLQRVVLIICLTVLAAGVLSMSIGGNLFVWVCAGWLLSGPLVLIDAQRSTRRNNTSRRAQPHFGSEPTGLVGTAGVKFEKLASSQQDNHDILN